MGLSIIASRLLEEGTLCECIVVEVYGSQNSIQGEEILFGNTQYIVLKTPDLDFSLLLADCLIHFEKHLSAFLT